MNEILQKSCFFYTALQERNVSAIKSDILIRR